MKYSVWKFHDTIYIHSPTTNYTSVWPHIKFKNTYWEEAALIVTYLCNLSVHDKHAPGARDAIRQKHGCSAPGCPPFRLVRQTQLYDVLPVHRGALVECIEGLEVLLNWRMVSDLLADEWKPIWTQGITTENILVRERFLTEFQSEVEMFENRGKL